MSVKPEEAHTQEIVAWAVPLVGSCFVTGLHGEARVRPRLPLPRARPPPANPVPASAAKKNPRFFAKKVRGWLAVPAAQARAAIIDQAGWVTGIPAASAALDGRPWRHRSIP